MLTNPRIPHNKERKKVFKSLVTKWEADSAYYKGLAGMSTNDSENVLLNWKAGYTLARANELNRLIELVFPENNDED